MEVSVKHLKRYFGATKAVDDVSFSFSSGHIFGFVGPNGAGKTTTMRVMATLDEPTAGDVLVDGMSSVEEPEKARQNIGFMPDTLPTHRDMTVHEYLDFFARAYRIKGSKRRRVVEGIEEFTGLKGLRGKFLRALSKGMKQRVSLARAIVHDPKALVLDEPAAGLDPRARIELRELLKALADQGKAILISSHILTELSEMCDGAIIIEAGKILRAGTLKDISATDVPHRVLHIRTTDTQHEQLCKELILMPNVVDAQLLGHAVEATVNGPEEACAQLLSQLVSKGYDIAEFRHRQVDLEHLFMNVTKGQTE